MLRDIFTGLRNADRSDFPETEGGRREWLRQKWAEAQKYDNRYPTDVKAEEVKD